MRSISKELGLSDSTISQIVEEDMRYTSFYWETAKDDADDYVPIFTCRASLKEAHALTTAGVGTAVHDEAPVEFKSLYIESCSTESEDVIARKVKSDVKEFLTNVNSGRGFTGRHSANIFPYRTKRHTIRHLQSRWEGNVGPATQGCYRTKKRWRPI